MVHILWSNQCKSITKWCLTPWAYLQLLSRKHGAPLLWESSRSSPSGRCRWSGQHAPPPVTVSWSHLPGLPERRPACLQKGLESFLKGRNVFDSKQSAQNPKSGPNKWDDVQKAAISDWLKSCISLKPVSSSGFLAVFVPLSETRHLGSLPSYHAVCLRHTYTIHK